MNVEDTRPAPTAKGETHLRTRHLTGRVSWTFVHGGNMPIRKVTLDQFMDNARAELEMFATSTRNERDAGTEGFVGPKYELRTAEDWWAEVAAYFTYETLMKRVGNEQERRRDIERRGVQRVGNVRR